MPQLFGETYQFKNNYASTAALAADTTITGFDGNRAGVTGIGIYQYYKNATSGDVLSASGGYWKKVTDPYLFLNSSNVIDSSQIQGALFADGTVSAPSISFTNETSSGLYRAGTNDVGVTIGGVNQLDVTANGVSLNTGVKWTQSTGYSGAGTIVVTQSQFFLLVNSASGLTFQLPAPASTAGQFYYVKRNNALGLLQITATGGALIDNTATYTVTNTSYAYVHLYCTSNQYFIVSAG